MPATTVATANILYKLPARDARTALQGVLAEEPDLVALQEWYVSRVRLLREHGSVRVLPSLGLRLRRRPRSPRYHWISGTAGGNVVGARAERFDPLQSRVVTLSRPGRAERTDRFLRMEPPRVVVVGTFHDRVTEQTVALISYHLAPGVDAGTGYREDRPVLSGRHQGEVRRLEALIAQLREEGHTVYAAGDSNFHGQRLAGLTSCWEGREPLPTHGRRTIDDVHGPGPAETVHLVATPSDHRAVVAVRRQTPDSRASAWAED